MNDLAAEAQRDSIEKLSFPDQEELLKTAINTNNHDLVKIILKYGHRQELLYLKREIPRTYNVPKENGTLNKEMVKVMLDSGLTVQNFSNSSELLYSAVQNLDEEFVEYLVKKGAKGEEKFGSYNTGSNFEYAVMSRNINIVKAIAPVTHEYTLKNVLRAWVVLSKPDFAKILWDFCITKGIEIPDPSSYENVSLPDDKLSVLKQAYQKVQESDGEAESVAEVRETQINEVLPAKTPEEDNNSTKIEDLVDRTVDEVVDQVVKPLDNTDVNLLGYEVLGTSEDYVGSSTEHHG